MSRGTEKILAEMRANLKPIVDGKCVKTVTGDKGVEYIHTCSRANEGNCKVYQIPETQWRRGDCPMADIALRTMFEVEQTEKHRVGQQKQKKKK